MQFQAILSFLLFFHQCLLTWASPTGYLIWGTPFLYQSERFEVNPVANQINGPEYQKRFGFRGQRFIANLNQTAVETNRKLIDVEDSTRSYKSPLSHW